MSTVTALKAKPQSRLQKNLQSLIHGAKKFEVVNAGKRHAYYFVTCTPELAEELIASANIDNRKIRQNKVMEWARYIDRGDWMLVGTVVFTSDGRIVDGQHRLFGCTIAKKPIAFLLQIIEPQVAPKFAQYVDIGVPRNLSDYLHFNGVPDAERTAPVLVHERNSRVSQAPFQDAKAERKEYLDLWEEIGAGHFKRVFETVPPNIHRVLALNRAFVDWFTLQLIDSDPEGVALFLLYIVEPENLKKVSPMFVLHRKLLEQKAMKRQKRHVSDIEQAVLIVKAWNLHYEKQPASTTKLRYRVNEDWPQIFGRKER